MKVKIILIILMICISLAYAEEEIKPEPIKIGVAGPFSGDLKDYGIFEKYAVEIIAKKINKQGGLDNKEIVILAEDDFCKPEIAKNVAQKFVNEGVKIVIGHICSGATKAALQTYKDNNIVVISPASTNPDLTLLGEYPNFFRVIPSDDLESFFQVSFAVKKLSASKIAIINDNSDYGKSFANLLKNHIDDFDSLEIVVLDSVNSNMPNDYSIVLQKLNKQDPDIIIWAGYSFEAVKFLKFVKDGNLKTKFIFPNGFKDEQFIQNVSEYAEGNFISDLADISKKSKNAIDELQEEYLIEAGDFYVESYTAMLCAVFSIQKAKSTNYTDIIKALKDNSIDTPLGKIKFDEKGDVVGYDFEMYKVKNGKFVEY